MLPWILAGILLVWAVAATLLLVRASKRLLQFDSLFESILGPMQQYAAALRKIATAEGLLHDHPEVVAFHRANMLMLTEINSAVESIKQSRPQEKKNESLPKPEAA